MMGWSRWVVDVVLTEHEKSVLAGIIHPSLYVVMVVTSFTQYYRVAVCN